MNEAKCVKCGTSNHNKPVTWVFVEYPLGIGLCYDCDNGSNKRLFWERKDKLVAAGKANSGKPAVTKLTEEEILENAKGPIRKKVKYEKDNAKVKTPSPASPVLPLGKGETVQGGGQAAPPTKAEERVIKMHTRKNDETLFVTGIKKEIKEHLTKSKIAMKTKIIWVVSTEDPTANDLMTIKSFVEHFSPGDEDIDIRTGKHRILVKNDHVEEENHLEPVAEKKPLSTYMLNKLKAKKNSKVKKDKPGKKFKSGAKVGALNNTDFPSVQGRQPWIRCTGCGEYKGKQWVNQDEGLHIGLCSSCAPDIQLKNQYDKKVEDLKGSKAA